MRTALCAIILAGLSAQSNATTQCGRATNMLLETIIADYYEKEPTSRPSFFKQNRKIPQIVITAATKARIILQGRSRGQEDENCQVCREEDVIYEAARAGTLAAIEEETTTKAARIANNVTKAKEIAAFIKDEAASLIHQSGVAAEGCLAEFTGNDLEQKIRNHLKNSNNTTGTLNNDEIRQKAIDYLSVYASPFSIHSVDFNNLSVLQSALQTQHPIVHRDIIEIANKVTSELRNARPTTDELKTEIIRQTKLYILKNVRIKADSFYNNRDITNTVFSKITRELNDTMKYFNSYAISTDVLGKLANFFGEALDNKIKKYAGK